MLDIGAGLTDTFPAKNHGETATLSCPTGYTGSPTRACNLGAWENLESPCSDCGQCRLWVVVDSGLGSCYDWTNCERPTPVKGEACSKAGYNCIVQKKDTCQYTKFECQLKTCPCPCAAKKLDIGAGYMDTFPDTPDGNTVTLTCPAGTDGNPARKCTSGQWGNLSDECKPDDCLAAKLDAGANLTAEFPATDHGQTATLDCAVIGRNAYSGKATRACSYGQWGPLTEYCEGGPDCPKTWRQSVGPGVWFPRTASDSTATVDCGDKDSRYEGTASMDCNGGVWENLQDECTPARCPEEIFDIGYGLKYAFPESPSSKTPLTIDCSTVDSLFSGQASATCSYGKWEDVSAGCVGPMCAQQTLDTGSGQTGVFSATFHTDTSHASCPSGYSGTDCSGYASRECSYSTFGNLTSSCVPNCPEAVLEIGPGMMATFNETRHCYGFSPGCPNGYVDGPSGGPYRICYNSTWTDPYSGGCYPISCYSAELFIDIDSTLKKTYPDSYSGQPRWAGCPGGYTGSARRDCLNGTWTPGPLPYDPCTPIECTPMTCADYTLCDGGMSDTPKDDGCGTTIYCKSCCGNGSCQSGPPHLEDCASCHDDCGDCECVPTIADLSNATLCPGDIPPDNPATAITTVDQGGCTTDKKCEYECNLGYYAAYTSCYPYGCQGRVWPYDPPPNATLCPNDDKELPDSTTWVTVSPGGCTSGKKCEYECAAGYVAIDNSSNPTLNDSCCKPKTTCEPADGCAVVPDGCGGTIDCSEVNCCNLAGNQHTTCQCTAAGGTVVDNGSNDFCGFTGSSCPIGWKKYLDWSITGVKICEDCDRAFDFCEHPGLVDLLLCADAAALGTSVCSSSMCCSVTPSHSSWQNVIESCPYDGATIGWSGCSDQNHTCTADVISRGCY